jgi:hypothetical protein
LLVELLLKKRNQSEALFLLKAPFIGVFSILKLAINFENLAQSYLLSKTYNILYQERSVSYAIS